MSNKLTNDDLNIAANLLLQALGANAAMGLAIEFQPALSTHVTPDNRHVWPWDSYMVAYTPVVPGVRITLGAMPVVPNMREQLLQTQSPTPANE